MKKCSSRTCDDPWKPVTEFGKNKRQKDGLNYYCKPCANASGRKYKQENKEKIREASKDYYKRNRESIIEQQKEYNRENRARLTEYKRDYVEKNRDRIAEYRREYDERNREKIVEYRADYYAKNREAFVVRGKEYRANNKDRISERMKNYALLKKYGLTVEDVEAMRISQNDACAICGGTDERLVVDHCHETGPARALLDDSCNFGIGKFSDNSNLLMKAADYLESRKLHPLVIPDIPVPAGYRKTKRDYHLIRTFGITSQQYDWLLEQQNYGCAICGEKCKTYANLPVDHCHDSGRVRGLLCTAHNSGLGLLQESPDVIRSAVKYLEKYSTNEETHALAA